MGASLDNPAALPEPLDSHDPRALPVGIIDFLVLPAAALDEKHR